MVDGKIWSDLAQECEAKGIKVEPNERADSLRKKLAEKKPKPAKPKG